jgi:hypothetical protein
MRTFLALALLGITLVGITVGVHALVVMTAQTASQAAEALAPAPCACKCEPSCKCCKGCCGQK